MAKKKVFSIGSSLAEALEESIESAQNYSGELRLEVLPLSKIETDPENPRDLALTMSDVRSGINKSDPEFARKTLELESLQSIANSIKTQGIINPITVYKYNDKYRLIAGERRTLASILAGKTDIQARILDNKQDDLKISLLQWIENMERKDLSLWERLRNLEKIIAATAKVNRTTIHDIAANEISNLLGCARSQAFNYKVVLNADEEVKALIFENKITNLEKAAFIAGLKKDETRKAVIQACIEGASLKQLKSCSTQPAVKLMKPQIFEKRGRQTVLINFGTTKNIGVAKAILTSILENKQLSHISSLLNNIDWNDYRSVTNAFKVVLENLEELNA